MPVNFTDTPPPKRAAAKRTTPAPKATSSETVRQDREDAINGMFQLGSVLAMAFGKWADAGAINTYGPGISTETVKLADRYDSVGKGIDALAQVGPFAGVMMAVTPLLIQLAANHRIINPEQAKAMGATDPETLGQQMELQANREAIQIKRQLAEQKRAMAEEMAAMEREMGQRVDEVIIVEGERVH